MAHAGALYCGCDWMQRLRVRPIVTCEDLQQRLQYHAEFRCWDLLGGRGPVPQLPHPFRRPRVSHGRRPWAAFSGALSVAQLLLLKVFLRGQPALHLLHGVRQDNAALLSALRNFLAGRYDELVLQWKKEQQSPQQKLCRESPGKVHPSHPFSNRLRPVLVFRVPKRETCLD